MVHPVRGGTGRAGPRASSPPRLHDWFRASTDDDKLRATLSLSVAWLVVCKHRNIEEYMLITYFYGNSMITLGTLGF